MNNLKPNGQTAGPAILFIHGIQEGPAVFSAFDDYIPDGFHVEKLLLKGHEAILKEFNRAGMKSWKRQVHEALERLCKDHFPVLVVGHSMGTLLALEASLQFPVSYLFLMDTPLALRLQLGFVLQQFFSNFQNPDNPYFQAALMSWTTRREHFTDIFGMIPNYLQLLLLILKTRKTIVKGSTPAFFILSQRDEMVSGRSLKWIQRRQDSEWILLESSGHFYKPEKDFNRMMNIFESRLKSMNDFIKIGEKEEKS